MVALQATAQTPFEGKVVYRLQSSKEKQIALITAYFGKQRLRMEFTEEGRLTNKEVVMAWLDSGTSVTLNTETQTYKVKKLEKRNEITAAPRQIAGYTAKPHLSEVGTGNWVAGFLGTSVFYTADELLFPVPSFYKNNPELIAVYNDRVVLGADLGVDPVLYGPTTADDSASVDRNRINAEAIEVKKYAVPDSLFAVPAGFTAEAVYDYSAIADSVALIDSMMKEETKPYAPKKKKSKPSNKAKSPQKSPAYRRKNG